MTLIELTPLDRHECVQLIVIGESRPVLRIPSKHTDFIVNNFRF